MIDFDAYKTVIASAVCQHMPSTAIASGMISAVDQTAVVNAFCDAYLPDPNDRTVPCNVPAIEAWLAGRAGHGIAKLMQRECIRRRMYAASLRSAE